jgi:hypothetical protein
VQKDSISSRQLRFEEQLQNAPKVFGRPNTVSTVYLPILNTKKVHLGAKSRSKDVQGAGRPILSVDTIEGRSIFFALMGVRKQ